jgi:CRP/FNR family cyclic AMP-dependent transcriptional regulator
MFADLSLFSSLDRDELEALSAHAVARTFRKNTIVINEGDVGDSMYVVLFGQLKVFLSDDEGKEIVINMMGPGEYFGELSLFDDFRRSASVMTTEETQLSIISKVDFDACLAGHPAIAHHVIKGLISRLRMSTENVRSLALMDVYGRVAHLLLQLAEEVDGKLVVQEKLTQQDIADRVGSSREMVSRIFKDLKIGNYIEVHDKQITINENLPPHW